MANAIESTAKHDAQAFKKSGDHSQAMQSVADHAHSMSTKDLKSEQQYWNSLGKASHDHLPGLSISRNRDGNVDSVKDDKGASLYNRDAEVAKASESAVGKLKDGQGPFDAFKAAGLSDREASQHAKQVMDATGRKSFKTGEKIATHQDGSVTTSSEHHGVQTQEKFNKDKTHETKVTQKNGESVTTMKDAEGKVTGSVEHKIDKTTGKSTDTTYEGDGPNKKVKEEKVTDKNGDTHTKHFDKDGKPYDKTDVENNGKKTTTRDYGPDGLTTKQLTVVDKEKGTISKTEFEDGKKSHERVDRPDGFTDITYKNGQEDLKIEQTNGPNGSYDQTRHNPQSPGFAERTVTINRGENKPGGGFEMNRTEIQGAVGPNAMTTNYVMQMTDERNGVGKGVKGGPMVGDQSRHDFKMVDGQFVDLGKEK